MMPGSAPATRAAGGPLTLLAVRTCRAHGTALRLEHAVKQLSRVEKLALAADPARLAALARAVLRAGAAQRKRAAASQRGSGSQASRTSRSG